MSFTPEALRLADALENGSTYDVGSSVAYGWIKNDPTDEAAAELRRLHASCEDYAQHKQRQDQRILTLTAQRDELLAALRYALWLIETLTPIEGDITRKARAAIARAEGSQK